LCGWLEVTSWLFALCIQANTYGGTVENPFVHDAFQAGMNVYIEQSDVVAAGDFVWATDELLNRLEAANVNAVSLTWPIFTDGRRSSSVTENDDSLNVEAIQTFSAVARARGFGVVLHPILDEQSILLSGSRHWRGTIDPWEVDQWFANYTALMLRYARAAEAVRVDAIVLGAELSSMEKYADHWRALARALRTVYTGKLTYASNRFISEDFPWEIVDFISVDAFFALPLSTDATVGEMVEQLTLRREEMVAWAHSVGKPLVFSEVGVTSQRGAFKSSWRWNHGTPVDQEAQARYYEAICRVWKEEVTGLYWWKTTLFPIAAQTLRTDIGFDPFGKPAEQVVHTCFE